MCSVSESGVEVWRVLPGAASRQVPRHAEAVASDETALMESVERAESTTKDAAKREQAHMVDASGWSVVLKGAVEGLVAIFDLGPRDLGPNSPWVRRR